MLLLWVPTTASAGASSCVWACNQHEQRCTAPPPGPPPPNTAPCIPHNTHSDSRMEVTTEEPSRMHSQARKHSQRHCYAGSACCAGRMFVLLSVAPFHHAGKQRLPPHEHEDTHNTTADTHQAVKSFLLRTLSAAGTAVPCTDATCHRTAHRAGPQVVCRFWLGTGLRHTGCLAAQQPSPGCLPPVLVTCSTMYIAHPALCRPASRQQHLQ